MEPLRKERTISNRFIGLVVPSVENSLIARILRGAEAYATESSFHVALAHDHGDLALQIAQLERMATGGVQGIAVYPDTSNINRPEFHSAIQKIHDQSIPLVMIDRYLPEIETLSVLSDNFIGMYSATQHMILTGHRRLTLLAFGAESGTADGERRRGFLTALQDYGIDPNSVLMADLGTRDHEVSAREIVKGQLTSHAGKLAFDGIVCMQDNMAYGAYLALREHGLDVPQDVALIGYDNLNSELFRANGLELSSVDQPAELIGSETARLLINLIENHQLDRPRHILLKPSLVLRTSCTATS
jgi:DNA-binding LacI/PurR family transcriptional regulator